MARPHYITPEVLSKFIGDALREDVGPGDHSSLATVPQEGLGVAQLIIKEPGILAGVDLGCEILRAVDPDLTISVLLEDGSAVKPGDIALRVKGHSRSILTGERLFLNCVQRMSGIATYTRRLVTLVQGTKARILDTRKTTPNFRLIEKWAVLIGGGVNHRLGLYDLIMLKDNHIDFGGGIEKTLMLTREYIQKLGQDLHVEIEARNLAEVKQIVSAGGVDVVLLDNMSPADMAAAIDLIQGRFEVEASGGITEANIVEVAQTGVDYISVGALTHSARSMDMSLKAV